MNSPPVCYRTNEIRLNMLFTLTSSGWKVILFVLNVELNVTEKLNLATKTGTWDCLRVSQQGKKRSERLVMCRLLSYKRLRVFMQIMLGAGQESRYVSHLAIDSKLFREAVTLRWSLPLVPTIPACLPSQPSPLPKPQQCNLPPSGTIFFSIWNSSKRTWRTWVVGGWGGRVGESEGEMFDDLERRRGKLGGE